VVSLWVESGRGPAVELLFHRLSLGEDQLLGPQSLVYTLEYPFRHLDENKLTNTYHSRFNDGPLICNVFLGRIRGPTKWPIYASKLTPTGLYSVPRSQLINQLRRNGSPRPETPFTPAS